LDVSAIEGLLESFATAALALELTGRIGDLNQLPHRLSRLEDSNLGPSACAAWHTDRGVASFRAVYDKAQSLHVGAHVMKIAWWVGSEHHDGWWHCYPKFARDWVKGIGRL
jgi:hypothetical protein